VSKRTKESIGIEDLYPPSIAAVDYDALEADVKTRGIILPITVDQNGEVVDGRNRSKIAESLGVELPRIEKTFADDKERIKYAWSLAKGRHLTRQQQQEAALRLKTAGWTQEEIRETIGVPQQTIVRWLIDQAPNTQMGNRCLSVQSSPFDCRVTIPKAMKTRIIMRARKQSHSVIAADYGIARWTVDKIVKSSKSRSASAQRKHAREEAAKPDCWIEPEYRVGDFNKVLSNIDDASVDLILTDPPYGTKHVHLYKQLGEFGARVLKPGGSLLAYTGQATLPEVLAVLSQSLRYWWMICMEHSGPGQQLPGKWVNVTWKPVLWFVCKKRGNREYVTDRVTGEPPKERAEFAWAQGVGEVRYFIQQLAKRNALIVDPFAGTGKWGEVAARMGRRWIGCDKKKGGSIE